MSSALFPSSHWGSNIGNVFFYLGTEYILREAGGVRVIPHDLPPAKAFGLTDDQVKNDVGYGYRLGKSDYLVLDGPMFDLSFRRLFGPYLKRAKELGTKVVLMSAGGINYSEAEVAHCREVLKEFPPYILTTRDRQTFQNYGDLCERSYDAICSAWFAPDAYPGFEVADERSYVTVCFDHAREPDIELPSLGALAAGEFGGIKISPVMHSKLTKVSRLSQRGLSEDINGYQIIRPCHQVLNRQNWRLFYKPNCFCSQTPYGYLNLYRNTKLTITDRLHASVATLAYGNPARLFIKSKRTHLLDRVNIGNVCSEVVRMDLDYLRDEKERYLAWMKIALSA